MSDPAICLLDANILLCLLLGEPIAQVEAATKLFSRADAGEVQLEITPVIVAEVFYTLVSFYKKERASVADMLFHLLQQRGVRVRESAQVFAALERLETTNVSFADAYLAACAAYDKVSIASFDRDFKKFKDIRRYDLSS